MTVTATELKACFDCSNMFAVQALAQLTAVQSTYKAACRNYGTLQDPAVNSLIAEAVQECGSIEKVCALIRADGMDWSVRSIGRHIRAMVKCTVFATYISRDMGLLMFVDVKACRLNASQRVEVRNFRGHDARNSLELPRCHIPNHIFQDCTIRAVALSTFHGMRAANCATKCCHNTVQMSFTNPSTGAGAVKAVLDVMAGYPAVKNFACWGCSIGDEVRTAAVVYPLLLMDSWLLITYS